MVSGANVLGNMTLQTDIVQANKCYTSIGTNSTLEYRPINVIYYATAAVTASTGGVLATAYTIPIPANLISSSSEGLEIHVLGQTSATSNAKSIGVQWGSTSAVTRPLLTSSGGYFEMRFFISRGLSDTTGDFTGILEHEASNRTFGSQDVACSSFNSSQDLKIVYTSSAASDVIIRQVRVWAYSSYL